MTENDKNIGWIGTGIMGNPMCKRLMGKGYNLFVSNRTKEKASNLVDKGATWCKTPAEVAKNSQTIFSIVLTHLTM